LINHWSKSTEEYPFDPKILTTTKNCGQLKAKTKKKLDEKD